VVIVRTSAVGYSFGLYILFVYGIYTWGARLREIFC
jgi:hypothetical protein